MIAAHHIEPHHIEPVQPGNYVKSGAESLLGEHADEVEQHGAKGRGGGAYPAPVILASRPYTTTLRRMPTANMRMFR